MKKCTVILLSLAIICLSSCVADNRSVQGDGNVSSIEATSTITQIKPSDLIGCWNTTPYWAAGRGDNHNFYKEGRYRFGFNEMDDLKRVLYRDGTWRIVDNQLEITLTSQTVLSGGQIVYDGTAFGHVIKGGKLEVEIIDPPMVEKYDINDLHYDNAVDDARYQDKQGKYLTVHFGNAQFWKLSDTPAPLK